MSYDPQFSGEPKKGMSTAAKVLLGLAIAGGVLVALCCGGFWMIGNYFKNAISKDPVTIRQTTQEIATISVPDKLPPQMSMNATIPFSGQSGMKMAIYGDPGGGNMLMLMSINVKENAQVQNNPEQMRLQVKQNMNQQGRNMEEVQADKTETIDRTINGKPASFELVHGVGQKSQQELWRVLGTFQSKAGQGVLSAQLKTSDFTEDEVGAIIDSIQ